MQTCRGPCQITAMHASIDRATISDPMLQVGVIAAFGGGIASSILLQKPDKAPIAVFSDNNIGL